MNTDSRQNLEKDPWGIKEGSYMGNSVNSSPRSKATRVSYTQSEYSLIVGFVKQNLKLMLRLVSTDIHNKEVSLSATEFNTLRVLFRVHSVDGRIIDPGSRPRSGTSSHRSSTTKSLSSFAPFYQSQSAVSGGQSVKVHMTQLIEWIYSSLSVLEPMDGNFKMNSLYKCVTVKPYEELLQQSGGVSSKLCITGCEESYIYVDSHVETLHITSCINCTIFVAAVQRVCTIEKCENVTLCVASSVLRVGNCVDCSIHSYTTSLPPVVYGDTRNLRIGPHNAHYPMLPEYMKRAGIKYE